MKKFVKWERKSHVDVRHLEISDRKCVLGVWTQASAFFERSQSETSALILKETPRKQGVRVVNACLKKMSVKQIYYSEKYYDDVFEYR